MAAMPASGPRRRFPAARLVVLAAVWAGLPAARAQIAPPAPALDVQSWTCALRIVQTSGSIATLDYSGLPGNQPKTYGNFVALWPSSMIAWTVAPIAREALVSDQQDASYTMRNLSISRARYTFAYSVGPAVTDICASAARNADGTSGASDAVSIALTAVAPASISVRYHCLDGYQPQRSGNWLGVWMGSASPYDAPDPIARMAIDGNSTDGIAVLTGLNLVSGIPYTLVYFLGTERTTAAAVVTFTMN